MKKALLIIKVLAITQLLTGQVFAGAHCPNNKDRNASTAATSQSQSTTATTHSGSSTR